METTLHPIFASVLSMRMIAEQVLQTPIEKYVGMLVAHDWTFEYSEDDAVYRKGRAELDALLVVQRAIDQGHALWNTHAPDGYRKGIQLRGDHPSIARAIRECM